MTIPTTIVLPGIVSVLDEFLRPSAATAGEGAEIRQDARGTTVSVCEGRHAATIRTSTPGSLEPILVSTSALAAGEPGDELKLHRLAESACVIVRADGELVEVAITPGTLSRSARDLADVVEGEVASGSTRAVFELDPRHLLAVAQALVATGAEKATLVAAPRWNVLAASAETDRIAATFIVAGEPIHGLDAREPETGAADDPLAFEVEDTKRRTPATRLTKTTAELEADLGQLPF